MFKQMSKVHDCDHPKSLVNFLVRQLEKIRYKYRVYYKSNINLINDRPKVFKQRICH